MSRLLLPVFVLILAGVGTASARQRSAGDALAPSAPALRSVLSSNADWARAVARTPRPHEQASTNGRFLYAATQRGLARSVDGGRTWTVHPVAADEPPVQTVAAEGSIVWVGTPIGVFRSLDAGRSWTSAGLGMEATDVRILFRARTGTLFAATTPAADGCGLYRSRSDGNLWSCVAPGPGENGFDSISEDADGDIVVTDGVHLFRSPDEGHTWQPTTTPGTDHAIAARFLSFGSR